MNNRGSLIGGLTLILAGIIFFFNQIWGGAWPIFLLGLGALFFAWSLARRDGGMMISATTNTALGLILLYNTLTNNWTSWLYLWPLLPGAVGLGMLLMGRVGRSDPGVDSVGAAMLLVNLALAAALWFFRAQVEWPSILWGMGGMFLLVGLFSRVTPLFIPGTILGGLGLMFVYQKATGDWASWSYTWALIPAFVGLGMFLAFLANRVPRTVGLYMMGWSLVAFTIFGVFFARQGAFIQFWPVVLILIGLAILLQTTLTRASRA